MSTQNVHHEVAQTRYSQLKNRTHAFCSAMTDLANNPPDKIIAEHFTPDKPRITEHGPAWTSERLPFLGKTFTGRDGCLEFFVLLSETFECYFDKDTFPDQEGIIVDDQVKITSGGGHGGSGKGWEGRGLATVVGKATFKAIKTGVSWEERFVYQLSEFEEEGRIGHCEAWGDPLSAWMAVDRASTEKSR